MNTKSPKLVVIAGPTGSGKTNISIRLAKRFCGSIVSADSRQIYREMTIGTAKPIGKWSWRGFCRMYVVDGVEHYNLDCLNPKKTFSAAEFKKRAEAWIYRIRKKGQVPFVVGGTGLYIDALVENLSFPSVVADLGLREKLSKLSLEELLKQLDEIDPDAGSMVDRQNPRRVIRALEVSLSSEVPFSKQKVKGEKQYDVLYIGVSVEKEELQGRIDTRIDEMIGMGLVNEVRGLYKKYNFSTPGMSGIGYREFEPFFKAEKSLEEVVDQIKVDTRQYAKRQMTWFKKNKDIIWCSSYEEVENRVADFLKK